MVFLTSWFGVTRPTLSGAPARGSSDIEEIVENSLLMQANAAANQRRPLNRWPQVIISREKEDRRGSALWRVHRLAKSGLCLLRAASEPCSNSEDWPVHGHVIFVVVET